MGRQVQRSDTPGNSAPVAVGPNLQQQTKNLHAVLLRSQMHRCQPLLAGAVFLRSGLQKQVNDLQVTSNCGQMQCCLSFSKNRFLLAPCLQQQADAFRTSRPCSCMQRRLSLTTGDVGISGQLQQFLQLFMVLLLTSRNQLQILLGIWGPKFQEDQPQGPSFIPIPSPSHQLPIRQFPAILPQQALVEPGPSQLRRQQPLQLPPLEALELGAGEGGQAAARHGRADLQHGTLDAAHVGCGWNRWNTRWDKPRKVVLSLFLFDTFKCKVDRLMFRKCIGYMAWTVAYLSCRIATGGPSWHAEEWILGVS